MTNNSVTVTDGESPGTGQKIHPRKAALAGGLGTMIEAYDFSMYGYLSVYMAPLFFPSDDKYLSLMSTLSVFIVSFVVRPIGGIVLGYIGDRMSRRTALLWSLMLMGGSSFAVGLLPTFAAIGVIAPVLLVLLRAIQGFSVGGEVAGAATIVNEATGGRRQGLWGSFNPAGATLGFALASGMAAICTVILSTEVMAEWGWRIPFFIAGPLTIVCYYLRRRFAVDKPKDTTIPETAVPLLTALRTHPVEILSATLMSAASNGMTYFSMTFLSVHLISNVGVDDSTVFVIASGVTILTAVILPFVGMIGDKVGLLKLMVFGGIGIVIIAYPALSLMNTGQAGLIVLGFVLIAPMFAPIGLAVYTGLPTMFPPNLRFTGMALGYNLGAMLAGGTAPILSLWLAKVTGNLTAPAFFAMAVAALGVIGVTIILQRRKSGKVADYSPLIR